VSPLSFYLLFTQCRLFSQYSSQKKDFMCLDSDAILLSIGWSSTMAVRASIQACLLGVGVSQMLSGEDLS